MKTTIHQVVVAALYAAIIFGLMWLAYSGGPSDAELRKRCSTPLAL